MSKNHWRRASDNNYLNWDNCLQELLKHYSEDDIYLNAQGYIVNDKYLISPHKKWRAIGRDQWYFYKNIDDLVTKYLKAPKNDHNKSI